MDRALKEKLLALSFLGKAKIREYLEYPELLDKFLSSPKGEKYLQLSSKIIKEATDKGISFVFLGEKNYPRLLQYIYDPPLVLYYKGKLLENIKYLAVVGSRKATAYGKEIALEFSKKLSQAGVGIISGMAFGVDSYAHRGALEGGGYTVAVLGCGVDIPYPKSNSKLYKEIIEQGGAVISEYPPGTSVRKEYFPQRNRIIAGISDGVLVVEAAKRSGSLITARFALEEGRDVFAIPGRINSLMSEGTNTLIKESGAQLITDYRDILSLWGLTLDDKSDKLPSNLQKEEKEILNLLSEDISEAKSSENIALNLPGWEAREVLLILWNLENQGFIKKTEDGKFYRRRR